MEARWYDCKSEASIHNKWQREEVYEASLIEDMGEEFRLPMDHKPTEHPDLDNVEQASLGDTANIIQHGVWASPEDGLKRETPWEI